MTRGEQVALCVLFVILAAAYAWLRIDLYRAERRAILERAKKERDELLARERPKTIRATYQKCAYGLARGAFLAGYQAAVGVKLSAPAAASIEMRNAATLLRLGMPISDSIAHAYAEGCTQLAASLNEVSVIDAHLISQAVHVALERRVQALNEVDRPTEGTSDADA